MSSTVKVEGYTGHNDLFDVFHEEPSLAIGDPYDKRQAFQASRHRGKQFSVPFQPKGKGPDAMIDKSLRLTVPGDSYVEPLSVMKDTGGRSSLHGKQFVPPSGSKSLGGSGTTHGLFGNPHDLVDTEPSAAQRGWRPPPSPLRGRPNFTTNPPKKGTFGYPIQDRSIGQTRFQFVPDEYERGRALERELKKEAKAKIPKPFISTGRTGQGIKPVSNYMGPNPDLRQAGLTHPPRPARNIHAKAWKMPNPPQKGQDYGTLSRLEYVPSPPAPKVQEKARTGVMKPPGTSHSRLSMWTVNPYVYAARPPPNNDISLLN